MLLVKNIAKIVGVDESGRLRVKGRDMNVLRLGNLSRVVTYSCMAWFEM